MPRVGTLLNRRAFPPESTDLKPDLIAGTRRQIQNSRWLMLKVAEMNRAARERLERSEARVNRSLTLLLESRDRVHSQP